MQNLIKKVFDSAADIRYVAVYRHGELAMSERPGLANASSSESDRYEELIVNPTLLKLVTQRGNIDCGGVKFVVIRYGSFWQMVRPIEGGHISVGVELTANPLKLADPIEDLLSKHQMI
ncbi:MAG: hypothetical protein HYR59_03500 [Acidobacteria bacterium]|nr:hypothetical protein [Acidobacteriota bacterium]